VSVLVLVLLIPLVHLDLQISQLISEKFEITLMLFPGTWGKMIHENPQKQKITQHCPFTVAKKYVFLLCVSLTCYFICSCKNGTVLERCVGETQP
jgi:hypothetical protein